MLASRMDIIGDLFRLRQEVAQARNEPDTAERYHDLEVLAAIAVTHGISLSLVMRASNVARDRIEALINGHREQLDDLALDESDVAAVWLAVGEELGSPPFGQLGIRRSGGAVGGGKTPP